MSQDQITDRARRKRVRIQTPEQMDTTNMMVSLLTKIMNKMKAEGRPIDASEIEMALLEETKKAWEQLGPKAEQASIFEMNALLESAMKARFGLSGWIS